MEDKEQLRIRLKALRREIPEALRAQHAEAAAKELMALPILAAPIHLGLYASVRDELSTRRLFEEALAFGCTVFFPRMCQDSQKLRWGTVEDWAALNPGPFGIPEPREAKMGVDVLQLIVVPGLGFGLNGGRLGYGAGWYDRSLKNFEGTVVGLGYDCQVLDSIPCVEHDHPVNWIVTELRALFLGDKALVE